MAASGAVLAEVRWTVLAAEIPPRASRHSSLDAAAEEAIRALRGRAHLQGLPRGLPGLHLPVGERRRWCTRIPGPYGAPRRGRHLDRLRRHARRLGVGHGAHDPRSGRASPRSRRGSWTTHRDGAPPRHRRGAAREPRRRHRPRRPGRGRGGPASASCGASSATASAGRCTRSRRCRTSGGPARAPPWVEGMVIAIEPMVNAGTPRRRDERGRLDDLLGRRERQRALLSTRSPSRRVGPAS